MKRLRGVAALTLLGLGAGPAGAQPPSADEAPAAAEPAPAPGAGATPLTLGEAIQLALEQSFALRLARQDLEVARGQIDEAYSSVYPQVDLTARYVRTIETPSPFAGSDAEGLFSGFSAIGWLAFNENTRLAGGQPLTLDEYLTGCDAGTLPPQAGCPQADVGGDENPFLIPNQVTATIAISQILYSGQAFAGIRAAEVFERQQLESIRRESLSVVGDVARAYYRARLAEAQAAVTRKSAERLRETLDEITRRVERGILPQFQQLSTEVEVANLESRLLQAETGAADAVDALELTVGLPVDGAVALRTPLDLPAEPVQIVELEQAMRIAERQRADLAQLSETRSLLRAQREVAEAAYLPTVSAFANVGVVGNVPDDTDGGPFAEDYWGPSINAGVQLSWNLFAGFATRAQLRQRQAELDKIEVQIEQARAGVRLELSRAIRAVHSAQRRLDAQTRTVERAELNFRHAEARVREGVSSAMELREASQQLDEARLNRLQALHDLLLAYIDYEVAIGTPPAELRAVRGGLSGDPEEAR